MLTTVRCSHKPCPCRISAGLRTYINKAAHTDAPLGLPRRLAPLPFLGPTYDLETFRSVAFTPEQPVQFPPGAYEDMPAVQKWFRPTSTAQERAVLDPRSKGSRQARVRVYGQPEAAHRRQLNYEYLSQYGSISLPMEMTRASFTKANPTSTWFERAEAPLSFFLSLDRHTSLEPDLTPPRARVYIAQAPLSSLPRPLQDDLPTPLLVAGAGKGHVYDSSIWLGLAPTYTPLHRDPNPNLLVQLAGEKIIRLFRPDVGREVFEDVARQGGALREGSEEMMKGEGREKLEAAVWEDGHWDGEGGILGYEARLGVGDSVFVPKGWWHSVRSVGEGMVGSVNWWFR